MVITNVPRIRHAARKIAGSLFLLFVWDVAVTVGYFALTPKTKALELPLSLFGTAVALYIGFAVNASYARWWEARGLWGLMINASRTLAREAVTLCDTAVPEAREGLGRDLVRSQIAYVNVLRAVLRNQDLPSEAARYLEPTMVANLSSMVNKPNGILIAHGRLASEGLRRGMLDAFGRIRIETTLVDIANAQGGMERIKNTPLPQQFRFFPSFFARTFCLLLPLAVVDDLGWYTPAGSALVGLMFLMAVQIGLDLMDPFADQIHDVPMTAMCRTVEIDLLQTIGEEAPGKLEAVDGVLW